MGNEMPSERSSIDSSIPPLGEIVAGEYDHLDGILRGVTLLRIERVKFEGSDQDVRLRPFLIGHANTESWQHVP
jgi:hypothetical protein